MAPSAGGQHPRRGKIEEGALLNDRGRSDRPSSILPFAVLNGRGHANRIPRALSGHPEPPLSFGRPFFEKGQNRGRASRTTGVV